jgi:hypothetical protein
MAKIENINFAFSHALQHNPSDISHAVPYMWRFLFCNGL